MRALSALAKPSTRSTTLIQRFRPRPPRPTMIRSLRSLPATSAYTKSALRYSTASATSNPVTIAPSCRTECIDVLLRNPELSEEEAVLEYHWIVNHVREEEATNFAGLDGRTSECEGKVKEYCERRADGEPLQYILGSVDFGPLTLKTRRPVFIPRPETAFIVERLVAELLERDPDLGSKRSDEPFRILDLCSGSGSMALLLARLMPHAQLEGIDLNPDAVALAEENATSNKLSNVSFKAMDVWSLGHGDGNGNIGGYDLVVSNPPYIPLSEWTDLPHSVKVYEDPRALIGNPGDIALASASGGVTAGISPGSEGDEDIDTEHDGLAFYRLIAQVLPSLLRPQRLRRSKERGLPVVAVEIGAEQASDVALIFASESSGVLRGHQVVRDEYGRDRMIIGYP